MLTSLNVVVVPIEAAPLPPIVYRSFAISCTVVICPPSWCWPTTRWSGACRRSWRYLKLLVATADTAVNRPTLVPLSCVNACAPPIASAPAPLELGGRIVEAARIEGDGEILRRPTAYPRWTCRCNGPAVAAEAVQVTVKFTTCVHRW